MNEWTSTPEFEENVRQSFGVPEIRTEFVNQLYGQLMQQADEKSRRYQSRSRFRLRPAWTITLAILALVIFSTLVIGPQRVYAEVMKLLSYIPGVGIVEEGTTIRVLAEPVTQTRDDITLTVHEAYLTDEKTIIVYSIQNVPQSALSHDESVVGCSDAGSLILPDGTRLEIVSGQGSGYRAEHIYPAIPESVDKATFVLSCIQGTLQGKAPENWELNLHFIPAPAELTAAPVINLPTPTVSMSQSTDADQSQSLPSDPFGIQMSLDQVIPLDDGYYLIGHTSCLDSRITAAYPGSWAMKAYDTTGQEIPLEPARFQDIGLENPQPNQWIYKLYGIVFSSPLTVRTTMMAVEFTEPVQLELDPRTYGFDDLNPQPSIIQIMDPLRIDVLGTQAQVVHIKYMQQGALKGFELGIEAEPGLQSLPFSLQSAVTVTDGQRASSGGSNRDESSGLIRTYVLSDGQMSFPLSLSATYADLSGIWETNWTPPTVTSNLIPTAVSQACLSLDEWKMATQNPTDLPLDLEGKVLLSRSALSPNPTLFIANLDGSGENGLVYGYGSLSPDGSKLVYSDENSNILIMDVDSGRKTAITNSSRDSNPIWSPDGKQIAFMRSTENQQIFIMNADGTDVMPLTLAAESAQLAGWSPDSSQILYGAKDERGATKERLINIATGDITDLFSVDFDAPSPAFSPDGQWIAYLD
ncbi:MAG TPA: hypothetical protein DCK95_09790, partial [Anaerolineaceae bacterium]|nr:hypothetical protein [Anaerolineaceae bacterium]